MKKILLMIMLLIIINCVNANYYCYQESANTSNQGGLDGNCGLNYSGSYFVDNTIYKFNYIKPFFAKGGILQYAYSKNGTATNTSNLTIPTYCFDSNKLNLTFDGHTISCINGTATIALLDLGVNNPGGTNNNPSVLFDGNWSTGACKHATIAGWLNTCTGPNEYIKFFEEGLYWDMPRQLLILNSLKLRIRGAFKLRLW